MYFNVLDSLVTSILNCIVKVYNYPTEKNMYILPSSLVLIKDFLFKKKT